MVVHWNELDALRAMVRDVVVRFLLSFGVVLRELRLIKSVECVLHEG